MPEVMITKEITKRKIFHANIANASAISKYVDGVSTEWVGMFRYRMSDAESARYGICNVLFLTNDSSQDAELRFFTSINGTAPKLLLKAKSTISISIDDGINFYAFDIMNMDTVTDISIGSIHGYVAVVR